MGIKRKIIYIFSVSAFVSLSAWFWIFRNSYADNNNLEQKDKAMVHFLRTNHYDSVVSCAYDIIMMQKPDSLKFYDARAYMSMGCALQKLGNFSEAKKLFDKADNLITSNWDDFADTIRINNLKANICQLQASSMMELDSLGDVKNLIDIAERKATDPNLQLAIKGTEGLYFAHKGDSLGASAIYKDVFETSQNNYAKAIAILNLVDMTNNIDSAEKLLIVHAEVMKSLSNSMDESSLWRQKGRLYRSKGNYAEAVQALEISNHLADSITIAGYALYGNNLLSLIQHEEDKKLKKSMGNLIAAIVLLILFFSGAIFVFVLFMRRQRRGRLSLQARLSELNDRYTKRINKLKDSMSEMSADMSALTLQKARLEEFINFIDLEVLKKTDKNESISIESKERIREAVSTLSGDKRVWESFMTYFDRVNPEFMKRLSIRHPALSKSERRMCALMVSGLDTKEIAALTNRSERTVTTTKYNLRKKIGVEEATEIYLRRLLVEE